MILNESNKNQTYQTRYVEKGRNKVNRVEIAQYFA